MSTKIIDGKQRSADILENIKNTVDIEKIQPHLCIIQVGDRSDSNTYIRMKINKCKKVGIETTFLKLDENISQNEVLDIIDSQNNNKSVNGIIIQLPLPEHLDEKIVTNKVSKIKDVDGFTSDNLMELYKRNGLPVFKPCTPLGIVDLLQLQFPENELEGKTCVVIGRSDIVGNPISRLLINDHNCSVIQLHSKTPKEVLKATLALADVAVIAVGKAKFFTADYFETLRKDLVVIDVGTNYEGNKLYGDVDFENVVKNPHVAKITPVPGGVGPMTVSKLLENTVLAYKLQAKERHSHKRQIEFVKPVPSDIEISKKHKPVFIGEIAANAGILESELDLHGSTKAKVKYNKIMERLNKNEKLKNGKYVLVAGVTPTSLGEGKSTTTIGLVSSLYAHLDKPCFATVRQPSLGPTFGVKGGAAGGGYSIAIPMEDFNGALTGDIHAVAMGTNLLAAAIDARWFHESTQTDKQLFKRFTPVKKGKRSFTATMLKRLAKCGIDKTNPDDLTDDEISKFVRLDIDPESITWKRVVDCNDRFLREITIGQAKTEKGRVRTSGFDIAVASEIMAILALSNDLEDLRNRVGAMIIGNSKSGEPITCEDIGCAGAVSAIMIDAINPNLMQTLEGAPVLVHAGPFANISIGANSVIADRLALKLTGSEEAGKEGYVVTEAGFDFTMGGERFLNIKCRSSGLSPDCVVLVATIRALKSHGGAPEPKAGLALPAAYTEEHVEFVRNGCCNLVKHIENIKQYNIPVVVAINKFITDTENEFNVIKEIALKAGANDCIVSNHWEEGGAGAVDLAKGVIEACNAPKVAEFKPLYELESTTIAEKIEIIAKKMYGAADVEFSEAAKQKLELYTKQGFDNLPICIAKTQYSLSHDPKLKGSPTGFTLPIRDIKASVGAGYLYALAGDIQTIPGLPTLCGFHNVEVNNGEIDGLF
ncbi:hypothetical protein DAHU10_016920 [Hanseniaspora uvarum]|nr:hypothetical protein DAHU10_016920 [Hanseniaspora uvarum]